MSMARTDRLILVSALLAGLISATTAKADPMWTASYDVLTGSNGVTLWSFDSSAGTLTSVADYTGISYVNSIADTGDWIYMTAWTGSEYSVHKINKTSYAIASVASVDTITSSAADRFVGMVYDGTDLWGMHRDGQTFNLGTDAAGEITSATPGIDIYAGLGSTSNGVMGALATNPVSSDSVAGVQNSRYLYGTSDLSVGVPALLSDYQGMDQMAGLAFDAAGTLFATEYYLGPSNVDPTKAMIGQIDPSTNNGFGTFHDFTTQLAAKGHVGFGGLETAQTTVIPLPAAAWMGLALLGGMGGIGAVRRKRRGA